MDDVLNDKVVIITGAAGGIGAATARLMAGRRAKLVLVDRSAEPLQALAAEIGNGALALPCDVTSETDMAAMAEAALERHARIDILIAGAGILRTSGTPQMVADTAFAEVNDLAALSKHPHLRRMTVQTPNGPVTYPAPAALFDGSSRPAGAVPAIGGKPQLR